MCWWLNLIYSETEKGIFEAILQGNIDYESAPWPSISAGAKDLIKKMLTKDPKKRITAAQALGKYTRAQKKNSSLMYTNWLYIEIHIMMYETEHAWLKEDGEASDKPMDSAVLIRMKQFRAMNKLKKLALKVSQ